MAPTFLLALLLSSNAVSLPQNDLGAVSTTNGQSTLVAWTNQSPFNSFAHRVFIRLLDSPFDRHAVFVSNGFAPRVASNGRDYLAGWSMQPTRFTYFLGDTAVVQLVNAEGGLSTRKVLNQSRTGGVTDLAWTGTHWIVSYSFEQNAGHASCVVLLDEALNIVANVETAGIVRALRRIDDRWWAFSENAALEIRDDGTIGDQFTHPVPIAGDFFVTHGSRPLVLAQSEHLDAIPFDPESGFGSSRPFVASTMLLSVIPFDGGSLVLLGQNGRTQIEAAFVDGSGELRTQPTVFFTPQPQVPWASLGWSANGPLFFFSPAASGSWSAGIVDLWAYPMRGLAPIDPGSGERVSTLRGPQDRRRSARH
jgi:hypothetical protein